MASTGPGRATRSVQSVLAFLQGTARQGPLLLVMADLDWADPLLVNLLERALAHLVGLPFAVLTTARPGVDHWPPPPGRHNTLLLRVDALDRGAADELARAMLGGDVSEEVRATLLDRSGGNPLFLEELAAMVRECGSVGDLPDTLRGLVAARLDRLAPAERDMLDNAAVLGPTGSWAALEAFGLELRQAPHRDTLAALADAELLDVSGTQWHFRSESVRDVTYQTLTKAARAQRHAGVARAIQDEHKADAAPDLVAYHYATAARLVREIGPVHGVPLDVAQRAAAAYDRAATKAFDQMVPTATVRLASEGLGALTGTGPVDERATPAPAAAAGPGQRRDARRRSGPSRRSGGAGPVPGLRRRRRGGRRPRRAGRGRDAGQSDRCRHGLVPGRVRCLAGRR